MFESLHTEEARANGWSVLWPPASSPLCTALAKTPWAFEVSPVLSELHSRLRLRLQRKQ